MERIALYVNVACWCIFYTYWLASAFATKKTAVREPVLASLSYRIPVVLAVVLLFHAARLPKPLSEVLIPSTTPVCVIVIALSTIGLVTSLWARMTLGRNWSSVVVVKRDHELVQAGPYHFVRHPIYSGMILMFAAAIMLAGRGAGIPAVALFVYGWVLKLRREERLMLKQFPTSYPAYIKMTKRLVPFVI